MLTHIYYKYCHGFIVNFYYKLDIYGYIIYVPCNIMGGGGGGGGGGVAASYCSYTENKHMSPV